MKKASSRSNGPWGYKAVVIHDTGRTYQPAQRNFKTRDEAVAYAQKWIDANDEQATVAAYVAEGLGEV